MSTERRFAEYLERVQSGRAEDIDALCEAHPEEAEELRRRYSDWKRAGDALARLGLGGQRSSKTSSSAGQGSLGLSLPAPLPEVYLDRYTMQGEIGRGGMGSILAVRDESLGRELAMKVLRGRGALFAGMQEPPTPPHDLARFLEEARITGGLQHPNIVPVHELGADPEGKPYFTMKLVEGRTFRQVLPLARAGEEGWSVQRALGVLLKVCEAVGFAHDKGVLHRDLKPANLMLGSFGEVYVMDWGLARDLARPDLEREPNGEESGESAIASDGSTNSDGAHTDSNDFRTRDGEVLGTPEYMPPEQASGDRARVGPPADIFAVGAMLYELLTGTTPNRSRARGGAHVRIAAAIGAAPEQVRVLAPETPAELCAICERAIARKPEDRYASMIDLAEDLRAYLEGRVVQAYATGAWAEFRKWVQRNPLIASLAGSLIALVTVGFAVISTLALRISDQNLDLERQRGELAKRNEELQRVTEYQASVLSDLDVAGMGAGILESLRAELFEALSAEGLEEDSVNALLQDFDTRVARINPTDLALNVLDQEVLSSAVGTIGERFGEQPLIAAGLLESSGRTYRKLGLYAQALPLLERALALRESHLGAEHEQSLAVATQLGVLHGEMGHFEDSESLLRRCLDQSRRVHGVDDPRTLQCMGDLGMVLKATDRFDDAERIFRAAVEHSRGAAGDLDPGTLGAMENLAMLLQAMGEVAEAEALLGEVLDGNRRVLGPEDPRLFTTLNNFGYLLKQQRRFEQAEPYYREALEGRRRYLGGEHPETLTTLNNYGLLLKLKGDLAAAEPFYLEALATRRRKLGDDHPNTFVSLNNLGSLLKSLERYEDAEPLYLDALEGARRKLGPDHPRTLVYANNLGSLLREMEEYERALPYLRAAVEGARDKPVKEHPNTPYFLFNLATNLVFLGVEDEARELLLEARGVVHQLQAEGHRLEQPIAEALAELDGQQSSDD